MAQKSKTDKPEKSRAWVFTLNNPTYTNVNEFYDNNFTYGTKYCIVGEEVGESGTPHYQGYIEFTNARHLGGLKKAFDPKIHWEPRMGTGPQAREYCMKDNKYTEWGTPPRQGHRSDIESMTAMINEGANTREVLLAHEDKALRILNNVIKAKSILRPVKRNWAMDVRIYWGESGTGKTSSVYQEFNDNVYVKMIGKWWDNYDGETAVLIDDFDPDNCFDQTYDFYLKLLDRYPLMVEWKGGSGWFYSKTIIFTSNTDPAFWFRNKHNRNAFFRRVTEIRHFPLLKNEDGTGTGTEVAWGNTDPGQATCSLAGLAMV